MNSQPEHSTESTPANSKRRVQGTPFDSPVKRPKPAWDNKKTGLEHLFEDEQAQEEGRSFRQEARGEVWRSSKDPRAIGSKLKVTPQTRALMDESLSKMEALRKAQQSVTHLERPKSKNDLLSQVSSGMNKVWQEANKCLGQERDTAVNQAALIQEQLDAALQKQRLLEEEQDRLRGEKDDYYVRWQAEVEKSASIDSNEFFAQASVKAEKDRQKLVDDSKHHQNMAKSLNEKLKSCQQQLSSSTKETDNVKAERDTLKKTVSQLQVRSVQTEQTLVDRQSKLDRASQTENLLHTRLVNADLWSGSLQATVSEQRVKIEQTKSKLDLCRAGLKEAEEKADGLDEQLRSVKNDHEKDLEILRKELSKATADLHERSTKLSSVKEVASATIYRLRDRLETAGRNNESALREERTKLQGDANAKVNRVKGEWNDAVGELQTSFAKDLKATREKHTAEIAAILGERDQLRRQNDDLCSAKTELEHEKIRHEEALAANRDTTIADNEKIARLRQDHVAAMEAQHQKRDELTQAYEDLIKSRDDQFRQSEKDNAAKARSQIERLDKTIEVLRLVDLERRQTLNELEERSEARARHVQATDQEIKDLKQVKEKKLAELSDCRQTVRALCQVTIEDESTIHHLVLMVATMGRTMTNRKSAFDRRGVGLERCRKLSLKQRHELEEIQGHLGNHIDLDLKEVKGDELRKALERKRADLTQCRIDQTVKDEDMKRISSIVSVQSDQIKGFEQAIEVYERERRLQLGHWDRSTLVAKLSASGGASSDCRMFTGDCEGEPVEVCVNILRNREEIIVVTRDRGNNCVIWHGDMNDCTFFRYAWRFWIRFGKIAQRKAFYISLSLQEEVVKWLQSSLAQKAFVKAEEGALSRTIGA